MCGGERFDGLGNTNYFIIFVFQLYYEPQRPDG